MKHILLLKNLTAFFSITLVIIFMSCSDDGTREGLHAEIIRVEDGDFTGKLVLKNIGHQNADTFEIEAGEKIQWLLHPHTAVTKISNIYKKDTSVNVFSEEPHPVGGSANWEGTIDSTAANKTESYNIQWINEAGDTLTYDPLIQVNPRK